MAKRLTEGSHKARSSETSNFPRSESRETCRSRVHSTFFAGARRRVPAYRPSIYRVSDGGGQITEQQSLRSTTRVAQRGMSVGKTAVCRPTTPHTIRSFGLATTAQIRKRGVDNGHYTGQALNRRRCLTPTPRGWRLDNVYTFRASVAFVRGI